MSGTSASFLQNYLPYLLRQADQTLSAPFYSVLTRHGVARSEWRVLAVLHEVGELSVANLAVAALSPQPTVTHACRRLEERGLVSRVLGAEDKRQRLISITDAGAEITNQLVIEAKALESEQLASAADVAELAASLRNLTVAIERTAQELTAAELADSKTAQPKTVRPKERP